MTSKDIELKVAASDHLEKLDELDTAAAVGQAASGYEDLTPWQTVKLFKVATAVCFAAAFSAATDGYQIGFVIPLNHDARYNC